MKSLFNAVTKDKSILKTLNNQELNEFCLQTRTFLIENVSKTGGHLASNLCTVELVVALHTVFSTPLDKIVFDVGHQCYTHKILTGRSQEFETLRMQGGLSGFPCPDESEHDCFISGHGNTAISAAIGIAQAKKIKKEEGTVIAIVGDGAFTGGMVYEGINNIDKLDNLIVILNDNKMSISKNVGTLSGYLTRLRTSKKYYNAKHRTENILDNTPIIGTPLKGVISDTKSFIRRTLFNSTFFEDMGFQYIGVVDGHNVEDLKAAYSSAQECGKPLFIHASTVKGKGFTPAEDNPGAFHGVSAFDTSAVPDPDDAISDSFSEVFGKELTLIANENEKLAAITAAMKYATGLHHFKKAHKERFFDVAMAEQHAITFAAGMAMMGLHPVVALYSTFLQRGFDQIIHDVHLQKCNVVFAIDRSGLVPADGETHQGIYDVAFFSQFEDVPIYAPINYEELKYWLRYIIDNVKGPVVIRYPRGAENPTLSKLGCDKKEYRIIKKGTTNKVALITYGALLTQAINAAESCEKITLYSLTILNTIPDMFIQELIGYEKIILVEDSIESASVGMHLADILLKNNYSGVYIHKGLPTTGLDHATVSQLQTQNKLDAENFIKLATQ